jgi:acetyltransferase-like isoleucine patch superfamily enzyme
MKEYGINTIGTGAHIFEPVTLGFPSRDNIGKEGYPGCNIGKNAIIRSGTIIYCDVTIGDNFQCGHNVMVREKTTIGNKVSLGTATVIEGNTSIGNNVNLQSMVYIPTNTAIEDNVFIGPNTVLTNDKFPPTGLGGLTGPRILKGAAIGANATIIPGVQIGEGSLVAAGAIVTRDVPANKLAIGAPARIKDLPRQMNR